MESETLSLVPDICMSKLPITLVMALVFGVSLRYQQDGDEPLGTGGAIKNCEKLITSEDVFIINGDILTNINLSNMYCICSEWRQTPIVLALTPVNDPTQFGVAKLDDRYMIKEFIEKPNDNSYGNLINAGIYYIKRSVIKYFMENGFSMVEKDLFPKFASVGMLGSYLMKDDYWLDIGTHDRYNQAQVDSIKYF